MAFIIIINFPKKQLEIQIHSNILDHSGFPLG